MKKTLAYGLIRAAQPVQQIDSQKTVDWWLVFKFNSKSLNSFGDEGSLNGI